MIVANVVRGRDPEYDGDLDHDADLLDDGVLVVRWELRLGGVCPRPVVTMPHLDASTFFAGSPDADEAVSLVPPPPLLVEVPPRSEPVAERPDNRRSHVLGDRPNHVLDDTSGSDHERAEDSDSDSDSGSVVLPVPPPPLQKR